MRVVYDIDTIKKMQNCIILVKNEGWMDSNNIKLFYKNSPVDFITVMSNNKDMMAYLGISESMSLPVIVWKVDGEIKLITRKVSEHDFYEINNMVYKNMRESSCWSNLV
jgi:hypothetical protein